MTIKEQLLHDEHQNKAAALAIAAKAMASRQYFDELMACFLSSDYRLAQRAAWSVSHAAGMNAQLIYPHIKTMIEQLLRNDVPDAVIRNSVRILKAILIPEEHHGEVMNACFILAEKVDTPIAIKAFSLSTLYNLYKLYPDIGNELKAIAGAALRSDRPAVKNVAEKIIRALHKSKTPGVQYESPKVKKHGGLHRRKAGKKSGSTDES